VKICWVVRQTNGAPARVRHLAAIGAGGLARIACDTLLAANQWAAARGDEPICHNCAVVSVGQFAEFTERALA